MLGGIISIFRTKQPKVADHLLGVLQDNADLSKLADYVQRTMSQIPDVSEIYQQINFDSDRAIKDPQSSSIPLAKDEVSTGEKSAPATVGSPGPQGELTQPVGLVPGSGAAGYVGKMSEISWIQRAREHLTQPSTVKKETQPEHEQHANDIKDSNYFLDDVDLLSIDEDYVVAQEMPPLDVAFILSQACFHALQGPFEFIHPESFLEALAHFPRHKRNMSWEERRWLAMANLVFAAGTKWLNLTRSEDEPVPGDHVEYYARARALGLDHRIMFDHPVLEQVQALGLLAFYLFVNGSITRYTSY